MTRLVPIVMGCLFLVFACASATIIDVPGDYSTIQSGINASASGDTVLVQPGTYQENIDFSGHNIVVGSLLMTTGDTAYISTTIIDGDSSGSVVTFDSGENGSAACIGFTLRNGLHYWGGGIYCNSSSPTIRNNRIEGNNAFSLQVETYGGGIYCALSSARISGNTIIGNRAHGSYASYGGGIYAFRSTLAVSGNFITGNRADLGAGLYLQGASSVVKNNVISADSAGGLGGGMACAGTSNPRIINNSFSRNSAQAGGGIAVLDTCAPVMLNDIFWRNDALLEREIFVDDTSWAIIRYCDVRGGRPGEGNIDIDPLFRDPANRDFRLMSVACGDLNNSPCIDAGHPDSSDFLLDCLHGLGASRSDIGAYGGRSEDWPTDLDDGDESDPAVPHMLTVWQNYPNPLNPTTIIRYELPATSLVVIDIFDLLGRKVETLYSGEQSAGRHEVTWDAFSVSSGTYFCRIETGGNAVTGKMLVVK